MTNQPKWPTYVGIFLVALATLVLEILLTKISSVVGLYHLAFLVISLTMLGMTAGAVLVFLLPSVFEANPSTGAKTDLVPRRMAQFGLGFALSTPVAIGVTMSMPLLAVDSLMGFLALLMYAGTLAIPFCFAGVVLTLALTRSGLPAAYAYGVDLVGAACGCALVIALLELVDAPSAVLLAAGIAAASASCFALAAGNRRVMIRASVCGLALACLGFANASADEPPLRPAWVKACPRRSINTSSWAGTPTRASR